MLLTIDPTEVREYSLPDDSDPKTVFFIGSIDSRHIIKILNDTEGSKQENADIYMRHFLLTKFGVKGWKNLSNRNGEDIPFDEKQHLISTNIPNVGNRTGLTDTAMEILKPLYLPLGKEVYIQNMLLPEQGKNSNTPSK